MKFILFESKYLIVFVSSTYMAKFAIIYIILYPPKN